LQNGKNWTPFAPHGWWAVGTAANVLVWQFVGWEAGAQLADQFRDPAASCRARSPLPSAQSRSCSQGSPSQRSASSGDSRVPLADLIGVGFGAAGREATAVLAVPLTMGTMNVYVAGAARLAAALAAGGALPAWLAGDADRSIPRRPLAVIAVIGTALLGALVAGLGNATELVRATAACFIAVYVVATASAVRILSGPGRAAAVVALVLTTALAAFLRLVRARPGRRGPRLARSASAFARDLTKAMVAGRSRVFQRTAFFTSAPIFASSLAVSSFSANEVGHMAP
jgi:amino acid efflux transporter